MVMNKAYVSDLNLYSIGYHTLKTYTNSKVTLKYYSRPLFCKLSTTNNSIKNDVKMYRFKLVLCLVELLGELPVVRRLVYHNLNTNR